ncbi:hypothetical protein N1030_02625 [Desulfovibrio mangrovi]|uniref:hypothetical protein n=1 Tax=Desulfovibrio mangrovi TaxID=2976983 RepID=UPI002247A8E9|nr:hypothetical protein [Desulfovibrio mangrovi]UZP67889.1 hypothetical protein N1030_02625 [Desulfovibrio mangrovi]
MLEEGFGIPREYVEDRIQTVFLDGMPVDDIDTAVVHDGARMGLAAALPGAAGIAMRRNSPYAALRGDITRKAEIVTQAEEGTITLLLFNLIMQEQGESFLERGVTSVAWRIAKLLKEHPENEALSINTPEGALSTVAAGDWLQKNPEAQVHLRVERSE